MQVSWTRCAGAVALGAMVCLGGLVQAQETKAESAHAHAHGHGHDHEHDHTAADGETRDPAAIYRGEFEDDWIEPRELSDWEGDWQSVYPLLVDGTLDPVMAHKAAHGEKTAAEYRAYYETGYETDVDRIEITGDVVRFYADDGFVEGHYASDGYEILTYESGNRGVRYIFAKAEGDADAPAFIQFSDHIIAPQKAGHYHLYWGDDRAALLEEVTNWPTYYPASFDGEQIVEEMTAH
ncbi:ZinT family metal-binding protein [Amaricoccus macauensis]|uniref:ZinT family metal-binding protein n=1 Tax=Amaricoccus macauensis TaxID=57001 RepID=UPI003C7C9662